ncbi:MAG: S-adenosylmethionine:tRNA ribosyltransferase-isomerase, partial [Bacteroidales bacterium]
MNIPLHSLQREQFIYELPKELIAKYPLAERSSSNLLVYKDGIIKKDLFYNIPCYIEKNSVLIYNNSKVIKARLIFFKSTGAVIEIFCLEPANHETYETIFQNTKQSYWKCFVGNLSKWKD